MKSNMIVKSSKVNLTENTSNLDNYILSVQTRIPNGGKLAKKTLCQPWLQLYLYCYHSRRRVMVARIQR